MYIKAGHRINSFALKTTHSGGVSYLPGSCAPRQEAPGKGGTSTPLAAGCCHDPHLASAAGRRIQPDGRGHTVRNLPLTLNAESCFSSTCSGFLLLELLSCYIISFSLSFNHFFSFILGAFG